MSKDRIEVLPDIKILGRSTGNQNKKVDPDIKRVQEKEEEMNVFKGGQPTKEEIENKDNKSDVSSSWLIIGLALIVVILIVVIVWYVLKENKENDAEKNKKNLPPGVLQPTDIPPGMHPGMRPGMNPRMHPSMQQQYYRQYVKPGQGPIGQTEHLPIQTQTMNATRKPTKKELEQTLSTLSSIKEKSEEETKKVKPSKAQQEKEQEKEKEDDEYTDPEMENRLASAFYNDLQQNIDMDDNDDAEEERHADEND